MTENKPEDAPSEPDESPFKPFETEPLQESEKGGRRVETTEKGDNAENE